ncbi:MAG TPA: TldD/PmbA family protein [Myxococcota bacterium]|nr:TldD/PmbA family protein [Myxococcota bacterium]HRY94842.1 TldD/PmbA family protein [Myxococcota bacterium]
MHHARTPTLRCALACLLLLGCLPGLVFAGPKNKTKAAPAPCKAEEDKPTFDHRPVLLKAMEAELQRSMSSLRIEGFEAPYFMAYELEETQSNRVQARSGSLDSAGGGKNRRLRVEVRVGNHELDNMGRKEQAFDFSFTPGYRAPRHGPLDDDALALRNAFWLVTDETYKAALKSYLKLKSARVTEVEVDEFAGSFTKEKPATYQGPVLPIEFDRERWERLARTASARFESHPDIFDHAVSVDGSKQVRYLVTSEGTRIVDELVLFNLSVTANTRAEDGMLLTDQLTLYSKDGAGMPDEKSVLAKVDQVITDLEALRKAPVLEPYTGPCILDGEATGVLFHEVIGHRLEGERQLDDEEGKTFKGQIGKQIIPPFLSVIDDPTLPAIDGVALNGFYRFDDEGVPAQRAELIAKGVLKSFLMSRTPLKGFLQSNGHGRSSGGEMPRARMGNTLVVSDRQVPFARLKEMLIEEVKRQGKPYGLILKNIVGGSTHTSTWGYQAYKGTPQMVYRVFPDGREELVRGVEIVGTPIASINKIVATSDRTATFNGFCGAESGYVPVSTSAPDVLMTEIELQRVMKQGAKPPLLSSPWNGLH